MSFASMTSVRAKVKSSQRWLRTLEDGLAGKPQRLGEGEGDALQKCAAALGIELITLTAGQKRGLELRRGAKPIASRYFGAPIQRYCYLYCIQQFRAETSEQPTATESAPPEECATSPDYSITKEV